MDLDLRIEHIGPVPVLELGGDVDLSTVPRLRNELWRLIGEHPGRVVAVDLDGVAGLDDTGIGILLGAAGRAREAGGDLALVCSDERLLARFTLTGLSQALRVVTSVHELVG